jgi:hypothetical protein
MLGPDGLPRPEIFSADQLHMNAEGYKLWTNIIGGYLPKADRDVAGDAAGRTVGSGL